MDKEYDLVVFGASGVTGKFVIAELASHTNLKWAVAGRNEKKLKNTITETQEITGKSLDDVMIITADVTMESTLVAMCSQTKLLVNCVGPFRFYGEKIIQACLEGEANYIDVCGEPQFLEEMQLKYYNEACRKELYIIGACGFDSIPCDVGVQFLKESFMEDDVDSGHVNSVETYLELHGTKDTKVNFGTWQSAVHSIAHMSELKPMRQRLLESLFPSKRPQFAFPLKPRPTLFKSDIVKKWCVYFMGSDRSVVTRTQLYGYEYEKEKPVQIHTYLCLPSFFYAILYFIFGAIFVFLAKYKFGRNLLEAYPEFFSFGLFTKKPIKKEQIAGDSFTLTLNGRGWSKKTLEHEYPDKEMRVTVTGPDPGYTTTSICVVAACVTLLDDEERDKMPKRGGVLTPGSAFSETRLAEKLAERGVVIAIKAGEDHTE